MGFKFAYWVEIYVRGGGGGGLKCGSPRDRVGGRCWVEKTSLFKLDIGYYMSRLEVLG